jgi:hypothetical protein
MGSNCVEGEPSLSFLPSTTNCPFFFSWSQTFGDGSVEAAYARTQVARMLALSHSTGKPVGDSPLEEAKHLLADDKVN